MPGKVVERDRDRESERLRGKRGSGSLKTSFVILTAAAGAVGLEQPGSAPGSSPTGGQSSQFDSSPLHTDDWPEHKLAAARGRGDRETPRHSYATRETTETAPPAPSQPPPNP